MAFEKRSIGFTKRFSYPRVTLSQTLVDTVHDDGKLGAFLNITIEDGYGSRSATGMRNGITELRDALDEWLQQDDVRLIEESP